MESRCRNKIIIIVFNRPRRHPRISHTPVSLRWRKTTCRWPVPCNPIIMHTVLQLGVTEGRWWYRVTKKKKKNTDNTMGRRLGQQQRAVAGNRRVSTPPTPTTLREKNLTCKKHFFLPVYWAHYFLLLLPPTPSYHLINVIEQCFRPAENYLITCGIIFFFSFLPIVGFYYLTENRNIVEVFFFNY